MISEKDDAYLNAILIVCIIGICGILAKKALADEIDIDNEAQEKWPYYKWRIDPNNKVIINNKLKLHDMTIYPDKININSESYCKNKEHFTLKVDNTAYFTFNC